MKTFFLIWLIPALLPVKWEPDFEKAKQLAKEKHELILLNFSGSDWCGPCIRMHREFFESPFFTSVADSSVIMVNADFPRNKKNRPAAATQKQNDMLAELYDREGKFPFTVLLNADGKLIHSWDGLPDEKPEKFAEEIKSICDAHR